MQARLRSPRSVEVDLLGDGLAAHVAGAQGLGAQGARTVTAQEGHVAAPLHADGAALRLLHLLHLGFQVAQALQARLAGPRHQGLARCDREKTFIG